MSADTIGRAGGLSETEGGRAVTTSSASGGLRLIESLPIGILLFDRELRCQLFNPFMERLTGMKAAEVLGKPVLATRLAETVLKGAERRIAMALAGETVHGQEVQFRSPVTGRETWTTARYCAVRLTGGGISGVVVVVADVTRRKEVEASETQQDAAFQTLFEENPDALCLCDATTLACLEMNRAARDQYGLTREEFLPLTFHNLNPADSGEAEWLKGLPAEGGERSGRHRRRDGSWIDVRVKARLVTTYGRRAVLLRICDVTLPQREMERLRHSEEQYRQLVELSPDAMFLQSDGRINFANSAALRLLGARAMSDLTGRPVRDFVHPSQHDPLQERIRSLMYEGVQSPPVEETFVRLDGSTVDVEVLATPCMIEGRQSILVIARDITRRKDLMATLRRTHANFQRIFQSSPAAIAMVTLPQGRFVDVNGQFLSLVGYTRDEVVGRTVQELDLWVGAGGFDAFLDSVTARGEVRNHEVVVRGKSGQTPQLLLSADVIQLDIGPCVLLLALDVTERKSFEDRLRLSQKMEAVVQLAGGLAHNFNNILSVIQANASLLQRRETLSPKGVESLDLLLRSTGQGTTLVRQMLTLSRKQAIQPVVLDLNDIIDANMPILRQTLGDRVALDLACASPLPPIVGDRSLLEQVLLNLVFNARDAMPEGGRLTLSTYARSFDRLPAAARSDSSDGRYVCLSVQDTGEGISPQNLPRIFEPFYTTKKPGKGTGLGLATVHGVIQQHRGWIEVQSEVGQGTTFLVFFPAATSTAADTPPPPSS